MIVNKQNNIGRRKSVINESNISLNKEGQNKKFGSPSPKRKRRSVFNSQDSPENIKSKKIIINTDNINVEKIKGKTNFQNQKRRGSYSDLFKLKQNYITNDIHLSQKQGSKYSDLYKNGIRVFEDFDIEDKKNSNNNSLKNSFSLSMNKSKKNLKNLTIGRRASMPCTLRNKNFNLLDGLGIKSEKNGNGNDEYNRTLSNNNINKNKKDKSNSDNDCSSSSLISSSLSSNDKKDSEISTNEIGVKNNLCNQNCDKINNKSSFKKSFQSNGSNKASKKNSKRTSRKITSGDEKNKNLIRNVDEGNDKGENKIKEVDEKGRKNNKLNGDTRKRKFKKNNNIKCKEKQLNDKINNLDEDIKKQVLKKNNSFEKNESKFNEEFKLREKDIEKFLIKSESLGNLLIKHKKYNMRNLNRILENNKFLNFECFTAKRIFKAQLKDKINNLDDDIKKQVLKRNNSFENNEFIINKEFKLNIKDIEKFLIKSKSLGNIFKNKKYNIKNIELLISKYKILYSQNLKDKLKLYTVSNENKINHTDTITKVNFDLSDTKPSLLNKLKSILKSNDNTPESLKKVSYDNIFSLKNSRNINTKIYSPSSIKYNSEELHSSEIKNNVESFLTREGKVSFFVNENNKSDLTLSLKKSKTNNDSNEKENKDKTDKEINRLINKIKEQNLKKSEVLFLYKENQEKKLKQLKKEKSEIVEKKIKFFKEKREKENKKMQHFRESRNKNLGTQTWKTNTRQILIALPLSPSYNQNIYSSNKKLNVLSQPISTGKEKKLMSLKHLLKNKESILNKEDIKRNLSEKKLNDKKTLNKFRSIITNANNENKKKKINDIKVIYKSRNSKLSHFKTESSYLDNVKNDVNELSKRKNNYFISYSAIKLRKYNKDYIMPVNDMDDVIQYNNVYSSLNENLSRINKSNN